MASVFLRLEKSLLPYPQQMVWEQGNVRVLPATFFEKVSHVVRNAILFVSTLLSMPFLAAYAAAKNLIARISRKPAPSQAAIPLVQPQAQNPADLARGLPRYFGFADSAFQTGGLGAPKESPSGLRGESNWADWLNPQRIEGTQDGDYKKFFTEILRNPGPYVNLLKGMGVTAHRISLEPGVMEPERGHIDPEAERLHHNFFQQFRDAEIKVSVTAHHFCTPKWAEPVRQKEARSAFDSMQFVDHYVQYTLDMMERFPEIDDWMTFNEPNVLAMMSCLFGDYPPGIKGDFAANGRVLRNLLIAHCKIYKAAKDKWGDAKKVSLTHQWLKFLPLEGNPVERLAAHFLSKNHEALYNFFKTGKFVYQIPGKANIEFTIPEEEFKKYNGFLDKTCLQCYGRPRLKAGFNGGLDYPGMVVKFPLIGKYGFVFGSSCNPGGKMMSFGPSFEPKDLEECIKEAIELGHPIDISETGCDAKIQKFGDKTFTLDNQTQREYFERILPILQKFQGHIEAFRVWTLIRQHLEWNRSDVPTLGVANIVKDADRNIIGHHLSPAAELLQQVFFEARAQQHLPPVAGVQIVA